MSYLLPGNNPKPDLRFWQGPANEDPDNEGEIPEYPLPNVKLPYHEMEKLVDSWRPQLAEHFPFAALYEGQSTAYLLVEMPFFSTAIACAALYGDLSRQIDTAQALIKDIGERMLLQGEKSLDLLLGILVLLAWYITSLVMHSSNILLTRTGITGTSFVIRKCPTSTIWQRRFWLT